MELIPILITHEQEANISNLCRIKVNEWVYYWDPGEKFTEQKGKLGRTIGPTNYEGNTMAQYILMNTATIVPRRTTKHIPPEQIATAEFKRHSKTFDDVIYAKLGDLMTSREIKEEVLKWTPYKDAEETPCSFPEDYEITFGFFNLSLTDGLINSEVLLH